MSINAKQLRELVIRPTLQKIDLWSDSAENLLMGTCAQESAMGFSLKQTIGPALGIYQMEPMTYWDIIKRYFATHLELARKVLSLAASNDINELVTNLAYATAIARVRYMFATEPLPYAGDLEGLARYYKIYYNTAGGAANEQQFIDNYKRFVV
jgi:hypothetical protein